MYAGLRITFNGESHLLWGTFPRELAETHFLCCLDETETAWCITVLEERKLKQTMFLTLLMWDIRVYKLHFTTVEGPGGLKDLMELSIWISCRII